MQFTAAYAGYTVCAPSRATLFTGRHSGHLAGAPSDWPLLPRLLQTAGYETRAFGKSAPMDAIVPPKRPSTLSWGLPIEFGFEGFDGQPSQLYCHNMYPEHWMVNGNQTVALPLNQQPKSRRACMARPDEYNYTTDLFADAAIGWLRRRSTSRPFFAYLSFTVPHAGGWSSAPKAPEQGQPVPTDLMYASEWNWPNVEKDHAASVTYLDQRVGDVLMALRDGGYEQSTVVFFATDNGVRALPLSPARTHTRTHPFHTPSHQTLSQAHNEGGHKVHFFDSTGGLRGFKRSYYEGGVRSPSIVRWPGVTPAGSVSNVPWAFWDVLPTLLEMARAPPLPANATIDGRSIVTALRGEVMDAPAYLYWTWRGAVAADEAPGADGIEPLGVGAGAKPGYAVRVGKHKGVVHACADQRNKRPSMEDAMELYDLEADPAEATDIAEVGMGPAVVAVIKRLLVRQQPPLSCVCYQC